MNSMSKSFDARAVDIEHALFQQAFDAILVADDDAVYVHANPAACILFGVPYEQLIGSRVYGFKPDDTHELVRSQWQAFLEQGDQSGIFDIHRPDGSVQRAAFRAKANVLPGLHVSFLTPIATLEVPEFDNGERFLTICAWSKRIKMGDRWISIEQFLAHHLNVKLSHGICPQAEEKFFSVGAR